MNQRAIDLGEGAFVDYLAGFLSNDEASSIYEQLMEEEAFESRAISVFGREVMQPRLISWAGDLPYRYSGQTLEPREPSAVLETLQEKIEKVTGVSFNHVLLNYYRDGRDNMGMHADNEPELGKDPTIAALSLGCTRRFLLKRKTRIKGEEPHCLKLEHGSLMVMRGTCQHRWRHSVPKAGRLAEGRINVTFRYLHRAPLSRNAPQPLS